MKRLFSLAMLLAIFAMIGTSQADSPRKALFEHFTNASCPPCASSAPTYYPYVKSNLDKIVPISYHVNWPGSDVMNGQNPTVASDMVTKYAVTGVPHLVVNGNAYKGNPIPLSGYEQIVNQIAGTTSPLTITIDKTKNGIQNYADISVNSSAKYLGTNLRVLVVEAFHHYAQAGNNGEKEFYFIARKFLTPSSGQTFNVNANETKNFSFSFDDNANWNPTMLFVVAWVQNASTPEILQAGNSIIPDLTGIENMAEAKFTISSTSQANKIGTEELSRVVTITNPNSFKMKALIGVDVSTLPDDWSAYIDKTEANVPAGGSINVNLTVTAGETSAFGTVNVTAIPMDVPGVLPVSATFPMYYLSEAVKYAFFYTGTGLGTMYSQAALTGTIYYENSAVIPFTAAVATAYTADDFDVAFFSFTSTQNGITYMQPAHINYMKSMLAKGKNVFVSSDVSANLMSLSQTPVELKTAYTDFYNNEAEVSFGGAKTWSTTSGSTITIHPFNVNGIDKDTITGQFVAKFNSSNQLWTPYSDFFTIPGASAAKQIGIYDGNFNETAAIRVEKANGAKLVVLGFPLEVTSDQYMKTTFVKNAMRWFVGEPEVFDAEINVETSTLEFAQVEIGKSKDLTFEVYNTGNADLKISKLEINNDPDGVFEVVKEADAVIAPDGTSTITVRFSPTLEKSYSLSEIIIFNNDPVYKQEKVALKGSGIASVATGPRLKLDVTLINFNDLEENKFADREVKITNTGIAPLVISELSVSNDNPGETFKLISLPPSDIPPAASFNFILRFYPLAVGDFTGKFTFVTNDPDHFSSEVDLTGTATATGILDNQINSSLSVGPNPFISNTNIKCFIPGYTNQDVNISLVDASGKQAALIVNGAVAPGEHTFQFDGSYLPSGSYYVIAKIGSNTTTLPVAIVK